MAHLGGQTPSKQPLEKRDDGRPRFRGCSRIQDYDFLGKLGEGTFGEVSKARSKKTGAIVALKKILMHNEKDGFPITACREIKLLKQLDHVNILKLDEMAVERSKDPKKKPSMFMVTPYMDHDLSGLLENPSVQFTEPQIKCYMIQLLEGCRYLHENKILHRDMKAANLLINNHGILQIADFGLARGYDDEPPKPGQGGGDATRDYTCLVVTRWYRPPELLLQLRRYTTAIDMWGVGCVFGEMFKGKPLFNGHGDLNQAHQIFDLVGSPDDDNMPGWSELPGCEGVKEFEFKRGTLPTVFREQGSLVISLLSELLRLDWRKRVNAIDALKHPYFTSPPYPARPGDLPRFEESHELDRRKIRGQKQALPPAPAGGSVGMGPNGQWVDNGRPPPTNMHRGRGHQPYQNGQSNHHRPIPHPRPYHGPSDSDRISRIPLPSESGLPLPPKPPPALDQHTNFRNNPPLPHDQPYNAPHRNDRGPSNMEPRRDRMGGPPPYIADRRRVPDSAKVDTYIPSYSGGTDRPPSRRELSPGPRDAFARDNMPPHPRDLPPPPREPYAPPPLPPPPPSREGYLPPSRDHFPPPRNLNMPGPGPILGPGPGQGLGPGPPPLRDEYLPPRREDDYRRDVSLPYERERDRDRDRESHRDSHRERDRGRYEDPNPRRMPGDGVVYERRRSRSPRRDWERRPPRERDWDHPDDRGYRR